MFIKRACGGYTRFHACSISAIFASRNDVSFVPAFRAAICVLPYMNENQVVRAYDVLIRHLQHLSRSQEGVEAHNQN